MNFQFIEDSFDKDLVNFVEEYNKRELYVYEIRAKYGWSEHLYLKLRTEAVKQGLIKDVRYSCKKNQPKNYYYHKSLGLYCVIKNKNQERIYYGGYHTEEEAQFVIKELKKHNWDKSKLREIQQCIKSGKN